MTSDFELLVSVMGNKCPKCGEGGIFAGLIRMNETCAHCGFKFEREQGYFLGAMSYSYILGFLAILPTFLYLLFHQYSLFYTVFWPTVEAAVLSPFLLRFSRLFWIFVDNRLDSARR